VRVYLILLAVLTAGLIIKEIAVPALVRSRLISAVQDGCKTCGLSLNRVHISLVPLALSSRSVGFSWGEPGATVINFEAERVYVPFSLLPLLKKRLRAGRIEITRPVVTVTEGDLFASSACAAGSARHTDLEIEGIEVKEGSFLYHLEHAGRTGSLKVSGISADAGPAGSSARLRGKEAEVSVDGLLAESGKFRLKVKARLFAAPDADVELSIAEQDLSALNPLLGASDGLKLRGQLIEARCSAAIRGANLKSSVYARYRGLGIEIKKNDERSALSAFFQNLLAPLMAGKQNADGGKHDRTGTAELERKPGETLVSFTLRGMKEAALQVSSQAR